MTRAATKAPGTNLVKPYEATPEESAAAAKHLERRKQQLPAPGIKLTEKSGTLEVTTDHAERSLGLTLLMEALGTVDFEFFNGLIRQLINASAPGKKPDEQTLN